MQTAKCTGQNLWDKFIVHYGLPEKILTDQGHNFESNLLKALCEIVQVKKIWTSGYHPETNGQCKHFNATLINMLGRVSVSGFVCTQEGSVGQGVKGGIGCSLP